LESTYLDETREIGNIFSGEILYLELLCAVNFQASTFQFSFVPTTLKHICLLITGWSNYVSKDKVKVKKVIGNDERLFSLSSVTSPASRKEDSKVQKLASGGRRGKKPKHIKEEETATQGGGRDGSMDVERDPDDADGEDD
jgi:Histone acetyltransferase subunit NuA4